MMPPPSNHGYGSFSNFNGPSQSQQPEHQQSSQPSSHQNDLEVLENLKNLIKSGQHDLYRPIPQPAALANIYIGPNAQVSKASPHPNQASQDHQQGQGRSPSNNSPSLATNTAEYGRRPPRLQGKESWDSSMQKPAIEDTSQTSPSKIQDNPTGIKPESPLAKSSPVSALGSDPSLLPARYDPNGSVSAPLLSAEVSEPYSNGNGVARGPPTTGDLKPPIDDTRLPLDGSGVRPLRESVSSFSQERRFDNSRSLHGTGNNTTHARDRSLPPPPRRDYRNYNYRDNGNWDRDRDRDRDIDRRGDYRYARDDRRASRTPGMNDTRQYDSAYDRGPNRYDSKDQTMSQDNRRPIEPPRFPSDDHRSSRPSQPNDVSRSPANDSLPPPPVRPPLASDSRDTRTSPADARDTRFLPRGGLPDDRRGPPPVDDRTGSKGQPPPPSPAARPPDGFRLSDDRGNGRGLQPESNPRSLEERLGARSLSLQERLQTPVARQESTRSLEERLSHLPIAPAAALANSEHDNGGVTRGGTANRNPPLTSALPDDRSSHPPPSALNAVNSDRGLPTIPPARAGPPNDPRHTSTGLRDDPLPRRPNSPPHHPMEPQNYRPPPRSSSRERHDAGLRTAGGETYRPNYSHDQRRGDAMNVDPPPSSRYSDRRFGTPSATDASRDRERGRQLPPVSPAHAAPLDNHAPLPSHSSYADDRDRRYGPSSVASRDDRDWHSHSYGSHQSSFNNNYDSRRREYSNDDEYWKSRQSYGDPPSALSSVSRERERYERPRDPPSAAPMGSRAGGWEERDRRTPYASSRSPSRNNFDSRPLSSRLSDYPPPTSVGNPLPTDDHSYPPPPSAVSRDSDRSRYAPSSGGRSPPQQYSRVRPRSPSPTRRSDDPRPPMKRLRDDYVPYFPPRDRRPADSYPPPPQPPRRRSPGPSGAGAYYPPSGTERDRVRDRDGDYARDYPPSGMGGGSSYDRSRSPTRDNYSRNYTHPPPVRDNRRYVAPPPTRGP